MIAKPDWSSGIADADRSGGPAIDLHIHDTHYIGLVCGVPKAVQSRGVVEGDAVVYLDTQYLYDDPNLTVSAVSGALSQAGRPFAHGFEFYLEKATLTFGFANLGGEGQLSPLTVILPDGTVERPALGLGRPNRGVRRRARGGRRGGRAGSSAAELSGDSRGRRSDVLCRGREREDPQAGGDRRGLTRPFSQDGVNRDPMPSEGTRCPPEITGTGGERDAVDRDGIDPPVGRD